MENQYKAADELGVSAYRLREWVEDGCPVHWEGGHPYFDVGQVQVWKRNRDRVLQAAEAGAVEGVHLEPIPEPRKKRPERKKEAKKEDKTVGTMELSRILGTSPPNIRAWVKRGCPVEKRSKWGNRFDLEKVRAWKEENIRRDWQKERKSVEGYKAQGLVTSEEISQHFSVSRHQINHWLKTKGMPYVVKGGRGRNYMFRLADVEAWFKQREKDL